MNTKNWMRSLGWMAGLNAAYVVLLVLFAANRGLLDGMMRLVIPLLLLASAALAYSCRFGGDPVVTMAAVLLLETGQMTQVLIHQGTPSLSTLLLFASPVIGALGICLISYMKEMDFSDNRRAVTVLGAAAGGVLLITLVLLAFGRNINGTRAWLRLGGLSLQLTEVFKPLYVVFHAVLWSSSFRHRQRFLISAAMTFVSAVFLLAINELGTLLVILCMWIILTFIYSEKLLDTAVTLGGTVTTILLGYGTMGLIYARVKKQISMGEEPGGLTKKIFQIYDKLRQRVMIFTNLDQYMTEYGDNASRQPFKAREMIMKGGLFGTTSSTTIPVEESDYAYVGLILRCGILFAVIVLVLFFMIFYRSVLRSVRRDNRFESVVLTGASLGLILPTFINVMGTTNFSFMTGIAIPFISHGGTNMMLSVFNVMLLIWGLCGSRPELMASVRRSVKKPSSPSRSPRPDKIPFTR